VHHRPPIAGDVPIEKTAKTGIFRFHAAQELLAAAVGAAQFLRGWNGKMKRDNTQYRRPEFFSFLLYLVSAEG